MGGLQEDSGTIRGFMEWKVEFDLTTMPLQGLKKIQMLCYSSISSISKNISSGSGREELSNHMELNSTRATFFHSTTKAFMLQFNIQMHSAHIHWRPSSRSILSLCVPVSQSMERWTVNVRALTMLVKSNGSTINPDSSFFLIGNP